MNESVRGDYKRGIFFSVYCIQHCFFCRPSDSTVSEDAGIEPRTVATSALAERRSNHSAISHPQATTGPDVWGNPQGINWNGFLLSDV